MTRFALAREAPAEYGRDHDEEAAGAAANRGAGEVPDHEASEAPDRGAHDVPDHGAGDAPDQGADPVPSRPEPGHDEPADGEVLSHGILPRRLPPGFAYENADPLQDDVEELEGLGWRIILTSAHIEAADYRRLVYIGEFDRRGGWKLAGHRDCADWLHFNVGMARGTAREKVRTARALRRLPLTSRAMARGEISFSKVRAVSRLVDDIGVDEERAQRIAEAGDILKVDLALVAGIDPEEGRIVDPESDLAQDGVPGGEDGETLITPEAEILTYTRECTTSELEKLVRSWKLVKSVDEAELERRRHASRHLSIAPDGNGMYVLRGRLDPEVGALLMRAVEAASDALFHVERDGRSTDWAPEGGLRGPRTQEITPRQRRADALGLLAERAMELGFGGVGEEDADLDEADRDDADGGQATRGRDGRERAACTCDAHVSGRRAPAPISGTRAQRYQVVLHVDMDTLRGEGDGEASGLQGGTLEGGTLQDGAMDDRTMVSGGRSHLEDGTRVSCETARRLCCDAAIVTALRGEHGSVLDIGRKSRKIPPALRRALEIRDGGCRFPGCGLRFTVGHHIKHWARGGKTALSNLISLCRTHHRAVHEDGFKVALLPDGRALFWDRTGWPVPTSPPPSRAGPGALERLIEENRRNGARPDGDPLAATWKREADIPVDRWARTWEALDR